MSRIDHTDLVRAVREFIFLWENIPDPVVAFAAPLKTAETRTAWVLLGSGIFQGLNYPGAVSLLKNLYEKFPEESLWEFPVPKEQELLACIPSFIRNRWSLAEQFPGIFWSAGAFVRRRAPLTAWVGERELRELWRDLGEIYYMGKGAFRPKAVQALSRITMPCPRGLGLLPKPSSKEMNPPLSMGLRRFVAFFGIGRAAGYEHFEEAKKRAFLIRTLNELYPEDPPLAAHALQFFLEEGAADFICREHTDSCKRCPLSAFCSHSLTGEMRK
ncbi:MAG: hypothetical protein LBR60_07205 [Fibrobacter sp.]|jgi:hypothetical protein|nr:hypothetical protein [Fibrobacter sp.]